MNPPCDENIRKCCKSIVFYQVFEQSVMLKSRGKNVFKALSSSTNRYPMPIKLFIFFNNYFSFNILFYCGDFKTALELDACFRLMCILKVI